MRGPNMSYCMFENTSGAMKQVVRAMEESDDLEDLDLSSTEQTSYMRLKSLCEEFLLQVERLEYSDDEDED